MTQILSLGMQNILHNKLLNNKKILFLLRAYNDIDHIAPIIYKMNSLEINIDIRVLIFNIENDFYSDYRLQFLNKLNIQVLHFDFLNVKYIPDNLILISIEK